MNILIRKRNTDSTRVEQSGSDIENGEMPVEDKPISKLFKGRHIQMMALGDSHSTIIS